MSDTPKSRVRRSNRGLNNTIVIQNERKKAANCRRGLKQNQRGATAIRAKAKVVAAAEGSNDVALAKWLSTRRVAFCRSEEENLALQARINHDGAGSRVTGYLMTDCDAKCMDGVKYTVGETTYSKKCPLFAKDALHALRLPHFHKYKEPYRLFEVCAMGKANSGHVLIGAETLYCQREVTEPTEKRELTSGAAISMGVIEHYDNGIPCAPVPGTPAVIHREIVATQTGTTEAKTPVPRVYLDWKPAPSKLATWLSTRSVVFSRTKEENAKLQHRINTEGAASRVFGYKMTDADGKGMNGVQYTVGAITTHNGPLGPRASGLHFSTSALEIIDNFIASEGPFRLFEVCAIGEAICHEDIIVARQIEVLREIKDNKEKHELLSGILINAVEDDRCPRFFCFEDGEAAGEALRGICHHENLKDGEIPKECYDWKPRIPVPVSEAAPASATASASAAS